LVDVTVTDHDLFRRKGEDLFCDVPLLWSEAVLGAQLDVPTLEGVTRIHIPPGTPSGKVFRLARKGLPAKKDTRRGDLHIKTTIAVPPNISDAQRRALKTLSDTFAEIDHPQRAQYDAHIKARSD